MVNSLVQWLNTTDLQGKLTLPCFYFDILLNSSF